MWKKYGTATHATHDNTMRSMRIACWIIEATYTHSEYVILIAFSRQSWLHERASLLRSNTQPVMLLAESRGMAHPPAERQTSPNAEQLHCGLNSLRTVECEY